MRQTGGVSERVHSVSAQPLSLCLSFSHQSLYASLRQSLSQPVHVSLSVSVSLSHDLNLFVCQSVFLSP